jgi:ParG
MRKTTSFKQPPARPFSVDPENWVRDAAPSAIAPAQKTNTITTGKLARLTIDLHPELHARFKATCALRTTRMIDEVRRFIEEWTQKNA